MVSRMEMTMMSNDLVLVRTPAPITRHMVSLFPPTLLHCPHCSCPVLGFVHSAGFVTPVTKANTMKCNLLVFPQQKKCTITYICNVYYILRKICRESDCQLQKCVPTITQQLLQSIIRGRIEMKKLPKFSIVSAITENNDRVDAAFAQELTDQSW